MSIAVLTPDPQDRSFIGRWPGVLERLTQTLQSENDGSAGPLALTALPWSEQAEDASALEGFELILPVIVWGYHRDPQLWRKACALWEKAGLPFANPADVIAWNSDKTYLRELSDKGVRIAPTLWRHQVTMADVEAAFASTGASALVVKPTVSAGAWRTLKLEPGQPLVDPFEGPVMIQPFLSSIQTDGETSLLYFGGRFSHAVNKRPAEGEFRIQIQFGGDYQAVDPDEGALALAEATLAAIDRPLLYARIDMARDETGAWVLMEAELIEPDFYLEHDPAKGAGLARAIAERRGRPMTAQGRP